MKSIDPAARRTNNNTHYTSRRFKTVFLVGAFLMLSTAMAVPFSSVDLSSRANAAGEGLVQPKINASVSWASTLNLPSMARRRSH